MNERPCGNDVLAGDPESWVLAELEPKEQVLWWARPVSTRRAAATSIKELLLGLGFSAFALCWTVGAMLGGHNRWDAGRAVPRFAWHNVSVGLLFGGTLALVSLGSVAGAVDAIRRDRRTIYALAVTRAIILEPGLRGGRRANTFPLGDLRWRRVERRGDGSGDVVFAERPTFVREMTRPVGFLAVDDINRIEAVVQGLVEAAKTVDREGRSAL